MRLDRFITLNIARPLRSVMAWSSPSPRRGDGWGDVLPVLMYHSISDRDESHLRDYFKVCTAPDCFRLQMQTLRDNGYVGVDLETGLAWLNSSSRSPRWELKSLGKRRKEFAAGEGPPRAEGVGATESLGGGEVPYSAFKPPRPVVLTFDDGFRDFYTAAYPLLREFGFTATMYLPTAFITDHDSQPSPPRPGRFPSPLRGEGGLGPDEVRAGEVSPPRSFLGKEFLSWNQVRELHQAGIEFGSHTVNHPKLVELSWPEIESEISDSKSQIERQVGARVTAFAYPYAFPQADKNFADAFRQLLHRVGYESCVTTQVGRARPGADRFRLSRLPVNSDDDDELMEAKLEGAYDWMEPVQRLVKRLKGLIRHGSIRNS